MAIFLSILLPRLAHGEFRALIVGVDTYSAHGDGYRDLKGTKDAKRFKALLETYWAAENPKIHMILDTSATKAFIEWEFRNWLIKNANSTDTLVFFFSGHGTVVPSELATKVRSAIVPHNVRKNANGIGLDENSLITGKFFRDRMEEMKSVGVRNFTMVIDACQSGAIARDREIPPDGPVAKMIVNDSVDISLVDKKSDGPLFNSEEDTDGFTVISAARSDQTAWEGPEGGDLTVGLTKAVSSYFSGLKKGGHTMTYADLQDRINWELESLPRIGDPQEPFVKGRLERPLFGIGNVSHDPYYPVQVKRATGGKPTIRIGAGQLFGVEKNAIFAIYPAGTLKFDNNIPIAQARVISVDTYDCVVRLIGPALNLDRLFAARARLSGGVSNAFVNIDLSAIRGEPNLEPLAREILKRPLIRSVNTGIKDVALVPEPVVRNGQAEPISTQHWSLLEDDGYDVPLPKANNIHELADSVEVFARDLARYKSVVTLDAPRPALRLEIQAIPIDLTDGSVTWMGNSKLTESKVAANKCFTFRVKATGPKGKPLPSTDKFLYVALLDCTPDCGVLPLWPKSAKSSEDTKLVADGKWRYLGWNGNLVDGTDLRLVKSWKMDPKQGPGNEVFKLIGTDRYVDYTPILVMPEDGETLRRNSPTISEQEPSIAGHRYKPQGASKFSIASLTLSLKG
jgi:hypothetical protein